MYFRELEQVVNNLDNLLDMVPISFFFRDLMLCEVISANVNAYEVNTVDQSINKHEPTNYLTRKIPLGVELGCILQTILDRLSLNNILLEKKNFIVLCHITTGIVKKIFAIIVKLDSNAEI